MSNSALSHLHTIHKKIILLILIPFLLTGCAKFIETKQPAVEGWERLSAGTTIGQTFVANYSGLTGIFFYLAPQNTGSGEVKLHLRSDANAVEDLAVSVNSLGIEAVTNPNYYGFFVPAQSDSNQRYYYAFLEVNGNGELLVGKNSGEAYLDGSMHRGGTAEDAQAAFQLSYSRRSAAMGLVIEVAGWAGILALGIFLFILPGWGFFSLLWPDWGRLSWHEKTGLSAGISLAIYPLFMLWTNIIGLHLGAIYAWVPPLIGSGMILWRNLRHQNIESLKKLHFIRWKRLNLSLLPDLVFLIIIGTLVITRFWVIRSLDMPMWGDSYQHTMITQLIIDHGGLFSSWQPYADLATFTYHFGFHSAAAVFDWITHMDATRAVLWVGQLLNILAVIALYPLALKIGRNRWAGVVAVFVAGLLSPMPMFYVNWGRYTQLAGQVILPVLMWVLWEALLHRPKLPTRNQHAARTESIGELVIACIAFGGLALTHYRVLLFGIIFLAILWIFQLRRETFKVMLQNTFWVGIGAVLLFLPWFIHAFGGKIIAIFTHHMNTSAAKAVEGDPQLAGIGNFFAYLPSILWIFLLIVIGIGLLRREKGLIQISSWWLAILLAGNPSWLGLPGAGVVNSFTVIIATYLPAGVLLGGAAGWLSEYIIKIAGLKKYMNLVISLGTAILVIGVGSWGAQLRMKAVQPEKYALVTRPDLLAAQWIEDNVPSDAILLVNSFPAYNNTLIVGSDGGWWLPYLTKRKNTAPPINYVFERDPWTGYSKQITELTFLIREKGINAPVVMSELRNSRISFIYVGQRQGLVNSGGSLFIVDQLLSDRNLSVRYHQDRVWIFQIQQAQR